VSERCQTCGSALMTWTRDTIIAAAHTWANNTGGPPTSKQWKNGTADHPAQSTVSKVFGSWNAMIEAAGWTPRPNNWHRQVKFSRDEIVHEIFEFRVANGRLPTYA
jgi:hypothetical protein